jgi:hypothetical protein
MNILQKMYLYRLYFVSIVKICCILTDIYFQDIFNSLEYKTSYNEDGKSVKRVSFPNSNTIHFLMFLESVIIYKEKWQVVWYYMEVTILGVIFYCIQTIIT